MSNYFPEPAKKPNIPVPAGMQLFWNSNTGHWAFRPIPGYSTVHLKKDSFIPKRCVGEKNDVSNVVTKNSKNRTRQKAKAEKNDEFYTRLEDIVNELKHYKEHFRDKVVYCPCDKAFNLGRSNFFQFFAEHFVDWGIKKLVATQYNEDGHGWKWVVERGDVNGNGYIDESEIDTYQLNGNGDFASYECRQIMKECDIVVTNPPFSLFRPFVAQLMEFNKKFLIMGNQNAITYKEIFPFIKDNKMWLGFGFNKTMEFVIPDSYEKYDRIDERGNKIAKVSAITWFTNLVHSKRLEGIYCPQKYAGREDKYPIYDNYDAIEIGHYISNGKWEGSLDELPNDYDGVMGVPITFLGQYNPEQFEIIGLGITESGISCGVKTDYTDEEMKKFKNDSDAWRNGTLFFIENGKAKVPYARILIRRKK